MTCWEEIFNINDGLLTITGSSSCEELGPLLNHKEDAVTINIEVNFLSIASNCFQGFKELTQINFPDSLVEIKNNIIHSTEKLENLTLPSKVQTLDKSVSFDWSYSLKNIFVVKENP